MMDVEVPVHGTVVVEDGNPYEIESQQVNYVPCWCTDDLHRLYHRTHPIDGFIPHMVGVGAIKWVWLAPRSGPEA